MRQPGGQVWLGAAPLSKHIHDYVLCATYCSLVRMSTLINVPPNPDLVAIFRWWAKMRPHPPRQLHRANLFAGPVVAGCWLLNSAALMPCDAMTFNWVDVPTSTITDLLSRSAPLSQQCTRLGLARKNVAAVDWAIRSARMVCPKMPRLRSDQIDPDHCYPRLSLHQSKTKSKQV